jgi:para-nitrobenzyl esterase
LFTTKIPVAGPRIYEAIVRKLLPAAATQILATYTAAAYGTPKRAFDALVTDLVFGCPARHAARELTRRKHTYRYVFAHVAAHAKHPGLGATHGSEIPFVFGTVADPTDDERALSRAMRGYWTRFARTGDPNGGGAPRWPAYDATDPYLELDTALTARDHQRATECDLLDTVKLGDA